MVTMQFCNEGWVWVYMASFWKRVYSGNAERRTQGGKGGFGVSISSKNIIGGDSSLNPAWGNVSISRAAKSRAQMSRLSYILCFVFWSPTGSWALLTWWSKDMNILQFPHHRLSVGPNPIWSSFLKQTFVWNTKFKWLKPRFSMYKHFNSLEMPVVFTFGNYWSF